MKFALRKIAGVLVAVAVSIQSVYATSYVDFTDAALTTAATNLTDTGSAAAAWALPVMVGIAAILVGFRLAKRFMRAIG